MIQTTKLDRLYYNRKKTVVYWLFGIVFAHIVCIATYGANEGISLCHELLQAAVSKKPAKDAIKIVPLTWSEFERGIANLREQKLLYRDDLDLFMRISGRWTPKTNVEEINYFQITVRVRVLPEGVTDEDKAKDVFLRIYDCTADKHYYVGKDALYDAFPSINRYGLEYKRWDHHGGNGGIRVQKRAGSRVVVFEHWVREFGWNRDRLEDTPHTKHPAGLLVKHVSGEYPSTRRH